MTKLRIPMDFKEKDLNRSVYNLNQAKAITFMQCLNIPVKFEKMMPGDEFRTRCRAMIDSLPMVTRQLSDWRMRFLFFRSSLSNYYGWMDNNMRMSADSFKDRRHHYISTKLLNADSSAMAMVMSKLFPYYTLSGTTAQVNYTSLGSIIYSTNAQGAMSYRATRDVVKHALGVMPLSLLDMVGFPVGFISTVQSSDGVAVGKDFSADYILCYLDAVRSYLVNNQFAFAPYYVVVPEFSRTGEPVLSDVPDTEGYKPRVPRILEISLASIDWFFRVLRMQDNGVDIMSLLNKYLADSSTTEFGYAVQLATWFISLKYGGHFLSQYERDMWNIILRNVNFEDVQVTVDIDESTGTPKGTFSINNLRLQNRRQKLADRFGVSGGRWSKLLRSVWGQDSSKKMDIPDFLGSHSFFVSAQSIMSSADTESSDGKSGSRLGQLNSVFDTRDLEGKSMKVYSDDYSVFFCIASLVPDVTYTEGLDKGLDEVHFDDEYYPQLDGLGFMDVPYYKYSALPKYDSNDEVSVQATNVAYKSVVGKNIAFIDLISNVNRAHGHFANDEYYEPWLLVRKFSEENNTGSSSIQTGNGITTYAHPLNFQYPFVAQGAEDYNFILQVDISNAAIRSKGKRVMPTLGD